MIFDRRHKWGPPIPPGGARFTRTCSVCGRTDTYESLIPTAFLDEMLRFMERPNPYRALFR